MRSKKSRSTTKSVFAILLTLLLAATMAAQPAQAQKFKVLHTFHGAPNDGTFPHGVVIRDSAGNFYGTTGAGGSGRCSNAGCGTAFKLDKNGKRVWLHSFNGMNGWQPLAGLLRDKEGNLYGTTTFGGNATNCPDGCGVVFKLDKTGNETVLHRFNGINDGDTPEALLVMDGVGNLYGTTYEGPGGDLGTLFKVSKTGKETILHRFNGPIGGGGDGAFPYSGAIRDVSGNIYGVTAGGGAVGGGAVYEFDATSNESLLYSFGGGEDGDEPFSVLVADAEGNLYGTTKEGGGSGCGGFGCGVVFELSPRSGGTWTESVLYRFCSQPNCTDGAEPLDGPLVRDAAGNIYGTTYVGGAYNSCNGDACGVVFKLDKTGKETVLHSFTAGADGALPWAGLTMDAAGNLYGTTVLGGDLKCEPTYGGCGTLFKITP